MTDRDRLIELLCNEFSNADVDWVREKVAKIADHLIANGVTIGKDTNVPTEWISVEDRLPNFDNNVLVICNGEYKNIHFIDAYELATYDSDEDEWILDGYPEAVVKVTHWMPLHNPPKEVE